MEQFLPVPIAFDSYLGTSAMPEIEAQYGGVNPDPEIQSYVNSIGQKIRKHTHDPNLPYTFKALGSNQVNAFALPGGPIYVLNGLLSMMDNEDELAGVIAHECAHINERHSVQQLEIALGGTVLLEGIESYIKGGGGESFQMVSNGLFQLTQLGFSRKHEYEADTEGVRYTARAGYNPLGMVSFFKKLQGLAPGMNKFEEWTSSHPDIEKRIENIQEVVSNEFPEAYKTTPADTKESETKYQSIIPAEWSKYLPYLYGFLGISALAVVFKRKNRRI